MEQRRRYTFRGDRTQRPANPHPDSPTRAEPYIPDSKLVEAVNLAIYLRRPLLLEGEAGCGKTRLASAVAYELGLPFYRWDIRSTSKAQDGLYSYDALRRLHDVQVEKLGHTLDIDPRDARQYCELRALGKAFELTDRPAVVLIDEIDKADLDFPNDLLTVLDREQEFKIPETGETIKPTSGNEPIVIITSNKEKGDLPAPFLRRCIYYYVRFPNDPALLSQIVAAHYGGQETTETSTPTTTDMPSSELVQVAAERFLEVRRKGDLFKNPGTSEFLDWIEALQNFRPKPYDVSVLKQTSNTNTIPFPEVLFKRRDDWNRYTAAS